MQPTSTTLNDPTLSTQAGLTWSAPLEQLVQAQPALSRFAASLRVVVAMLTTLLLNQASDLPGAPVLLLLAYDLWAAWLLWLALKGDRQHLAHLGIDVVWAIGMLQLSSGADGLLVLTLLQPVLVASIAFGATAGLCLTAIATLVLVLDPIALLQGQLRIQVDHLAPSLAILATVPAAALLARPLALLRAQRGLVDELYQQLDSRRGLNVTATGLLSHLRKRLHVDVAALWLTEPTDPAVWLCTEDEPNLRSQGSARARLLALAARLPLQVVAQRSGAGLLARLRLPGLAPLKTDEHEALQQLAALLSVRALVVVPMCRRGRCIGRLAIGLHAQHALGAGQARLEGVAADALRLLESAQRVDQLQTEGEDIERARIGRDLHDSAVQPYLGLKFALEAVLLRTTPDNPMRSDLQAVVRLATRETEALRDLIADMRNPTPRGDNALVPAVRRQVRRFTELFGIEVQLDAPAQVMTSRQMAVQIFHLVNEALNNVRKHTQATEVRLSLRTAPGAVRLRISDNGGSVLRRSGAEFHPTSLAERVDALGGVLTLHRPDGLNTELVITIPLAEGATP